MAYTARAVKRHAAQPSKTATGLQPMRSPCYCKHARHTARQCLFMHDTVVAQHIESRLQVWSEPSMVEAGAYEFADTAKFLAAGQIHVLSIMPVLTHCCLALSASCLSFVARCKVQPVTQQLVSSCMATQREVNPCMPSAPLALCTKAHAFVEHNHLI